jgi:hypothetical protein
MLKPNIHYAITQELGYFRFYEWNAMLFVKTPVTADGPMYELGANLKMRMVGQEGGAYDFYGVKCQDISLGKLQRNPVFKPNWLDMGLTQSKMHRYARTYNLLN